MKFIAKYYQKLRVFYYKKFLSNVAVSKGVRVLGATLFYASEGGAFRLEDGVQFGYFPSPYFYNTSNYLFAGGGGVICIEKGSILNNNFNLCALNSGIFIGKNCLFGVNLQILNADFHGLKIKERNDFHSIKSAEVRIDDDCFVGNNVTILKGVWLKKGCVVGNGSVVTKSFEENSLIAGNPARLIKIINQKEENV